MFCANSNPGKIYINLLDKVEKLVLIFMHLCQKMIQIIKLKLNMNNYTENCKFKRSKYNSKN
jgi:hypothetical protein